MIRKQESFFPEPETGRSLMERLEEGLLPLINVVFLLLMFFLIAGIILSDELPPLPQSLAGDQGDQPQLDLVVDAQGQLRHEGREITKQQLSERLPTYDVENRLRVGAHENLSMGELEALFSALAEAGHPEIILLTDQNP